MSSSASQSPPAKGLLYAFTEWVDRQPNKQAFSFLDDKGDVKVSLTYRQLLASADNVAAHLLKSKSAGGAGLSKGDRVVLVYPPSLDFIVAFMGCLRAG